MKYVLSGMVAIVAVELLFRLPLLQAVKSSIKTSQKAAWVIFSSSISDHWKERVILLYAGVIFTNAVKLSLYLLALLSPVAVVGILADLQTVDLLSFMMSLEGVLFVSIVSIGYVVARTRFV